MKQKRVVLISSLAARFRVCDGWDFKTLTKYLLSGSWVEKNYPEINIDDPYFVLHGSGSRYDVDKMIEDFDIELSGADRWGELNGMSIKEVLENRGW